MTRLATLAALCLALTTLATAPLPLWQRLADGRPDASAPVAAATRPSPAYVRCELVTEANATLPGHNYGREGVQYRIVTANPTVAEALAARQAAYRAAGLTAEAMARCALECVASGDTAAAIAMLARLAAIDAANPIPGQ